MILAAFYPTIPLTVAIGLVLPQKPSFFAKTYPVAMIKAFRRKILALKIEVWLSLMVPVSQLFTGVQYGLLWIMGAPRLNCLFCSGYCLKVWACLRKDSPLMRRADHQSRFR